MANDETYHLSLFQSGDTVSHGGKFDITFTEPTGSPTQQAGFVRVETTHKKNPGQSGEIYLNPDAVRLRFP